MTSGEKLYKAYKVLNNNIFDTWKKLSYSLIGEVLTDDDNLMKNTVVIITADHGQEFNDYRNNYSGIHLRVVNTTLYI